MNSDQDAQTAAQPVILLLIASVLFLQPVMQHPSSPLATRIYRVGPLMYGKRPSLGELARWVRRA